MRIIIPERIRRRIATTRHICLTLYRCAFECCVQIGGGNIFNADKNIKRLRGQRKTLSRGRDPVKYGPSRGRKSESTASACCISEEMTCSSISSATRLVCGNVMRKSTLGALAGSRFYLQADVNVPMAEPRFRPSARRNIDRYFHKQRAGRATRRDTTDVNSSNCFYILGCVSSRLAATRPGMHFPRARPATGYYIDFRNEREAILSPVAAHSSGGISRDSPIRYF